MTSGARISKERLKANKEDTLIFRDQDEAIILTIKYSFWQFIGPKTRDDINEKMLELFG